MALLLDNSMDFANTAGNFSWLTFLFSLGSLLVSIVVAGYAFREHRSSRENLIHEMRQEWHGLQPSWSRILMAEHGPNFHYVDASSSERERAKKLDKDLRNDTRDSNNIGYDAALSLRPDVRVVTRFLNYAADSVLRGKWRMSEAYEVFGPDVARHHQTIRLLAHRRGDVPAWLEQALELNTFDEHNCVFLFAFFLRAEQCRRGDTYAHFAVELAKEMRGRYKAEIRHSIFNVKRTRGRLILPLHLNRLLWRAKHPSVRTTFGMEPDTIVNGEERKLLKYPLEPNWLLNFRIWRSTVSLERGRDNDTLSTPGSEEHPWGT